MQDGTQLAFSNTDAPMTSYVSFALGTALIVSAGLIARRRLTPSVSLRPAHRYTNDDIVWL